MRLLAVLALTGCFAPTKLVTSPQFQQLAWHVVSRLTEAATEAAIAENFPAAPPPSYVAAQPTVIVVQPHEPAVLVYAVPR